MSCIILLMYCTVPELQERCYLGAQTSLFYHNLPDVASGERNLSLI